MKLCVRSFIMFACLAWLSAANLHAQMELLWSDDFSDGEYNTNVPWWVWEDKYGNPAGSGKVENGELVMYAPNPVFNPPLCVMWTAGDTINQRYTQPDFYMTCRMMMPPNGDAFHGEMPHIYCRASLDEVTWYVVIFCPRGSRGAGIYIYTYSGTAHFVADPLIQPNTYFNVALKVEQDTINCSVYQGPFPPDEWELTYVIPKAYHVEPDNVVGLLTIGAWYITELHIDNIEYWSLTELGCQGVIGDPTGDGSINVLDVLAVANHILGIITIEEDAICRADCNGDETINILDCLNIANVILGIIPECPGSGCKTAAASQEPVIVR